MTAELTPDDLAAMRKNHRPTMLYGDGDKPMCICGSVWWPCDAVRLLDEVERLRDELHYAGWVAEAAKVVN